MASLKGNRVQLNCILIPRANDVFRSLFSNKWQKTTGKKWKNKPDDGNEFISSIGKTVWTNATCRQKVLLESGDIRFWDLKLLNHVLQNVNLDDMIKLKNEKLEIRTLFDACNNLSYENDVTDAELNRVKSLVEKIELLFNNLIDEMENLDINDNFQAELNELVAKDFQQAAFKFFSTKNYSRTINAYSEAIKLTTLSKKHLGELYANRSEVYLLDISQININVFMLTSGGNRNLALEDAKRAIELCPNWNTAYYRLGCAYHALKKYEKAVKCFNIATELGKPRAEFIGIHNECKKKMEEIKMASSASSYPEKFPENEQELVDEFNQRSGMDLTVEMFLKMEKLLKDRDDPNANVWQAHRYMLGFDAEKNYDLAIKLYTKAASQGNAEAMYNLGVIYREGKYVEKDLNKSVKLLNDASKKRAEETGFRATGYKAVGVSEAQFELGRMHQKGIGVSRDNKKAISFYTKSSENGDKHAPRILAGFYFNGSYVEKDAQKAVQYWKLAAQRYDVISMRSLAEFYLIYDMDPDKAMEWHERAIKSGNLIDQNVSKMFVSLVGKLRDEFKSKDDEMARWEKKNGFTSMDCSMTDRRKRFSENKLPGSTKFGKYLSSLRGTECLPCDYSIGEENFKYNPDVVNNFAAKGSVTALQLKAAITHFQTACFYLNDTFYKDNRRIIIHSLAECFRITEKIVAWTLLVHERAMEVLCWAMMNRSVRKSQIDKDTRVCYTVLNANSLDIVISLLRKSILKYPDDFWFLKTLCALLGFQFAHLEGIKIADEGLKLFPDNVDFLYFKSAHIRNLTRYDSKVAIEALEKFIAVAPLDDPKVPEVYYSIAYEHVKAVGGNEHLSETARSVTLDLVAKYYVLGLEAEKNQLPFFLPVKCDQKKFLDAMSALKPFKMAMNRQPRPPARKVGEIKEEVKEEMKKGGEKKKEIMREMEKEEIKNETKDAEEKEVKKEKKKDVEKKEEMKKNAKKKQEIKNETKKDAEEKDAKKEKKKDAEKKDVEKKEEMKKNAKKKQEIKNETKKDAEEKEVKKEKKKDAEKKKVKKETKKDAEKKEEMKKNAKKKQDVKKDNSNEISEMKKEKIDSVIDETKKNDAKKLVTKDKIKMEATKEKVNRPKKDKMKKGEEGNEAKKDVVQPKTKKDVNSKTKNEEIKLKTKEEELKSKAKKEELKPKAKKEVNPKTKEEERKPNTKKEELKSKAKKEELKSKAKKEELKLKTGGKKEESSDERKDEIKKDQVKKNTSKDKDKKEIMKDKIKMGEKKDKLNGAKMDQVKKDEIKQQISKERLTQLTDPQRESVIRDHRKVISDLRATFSKLGNSFNTQFTMKTKLRQKGPPQLAEVKSITLQEMDPLKEHIYEGFELKCVIIDEPTLGFSGVGIVIEDENGDVQRACIYNIKQDNEVHNKIGYGCKITILNPYFRIAMDQKQIIRVDDISSVIFDAGPDLSRCRYCGKSGSVMKCGNCKKACYCSKECQKSDWINLRHNFICTGL